MNLIVRRLLMMFALPVMERVVVRTLRRFKTKRQAAKRSRNNIATNDVIDSTVTDP